LTEGEILNLNNFDLSAMLSQINLLGFSSLFSFLTQAISVPSTLEESMQFLSYFHCSDLSQHFKQSISIVSSNLKQIPFDFLKSLSFSTLESIFSSSTLKIPNEDFLFELISALVSEDKRFSRLFRFVYLPKVSGNLVKKVFMNIEVEDIDKDLLEFFKTKLFLDIPFDQNHSSSNRYEAATPIPIISSLRKQNPNFVSVKASSFYSSEKEAHHLLDDDSTYAGTKNIENSSFTYSFPNHQIFISSYLVKSIPPPKAHLYDWRQRFLRNWKLEGSNDEILWDKIDSHSYDATLTQENPEATFACKTSKAFKHLKITQTGPCSLNFHYFGLRYLEFYGTISSHSS
jgi:hypothetical protein